MKSNTKENSSTQRKTIPKIKEIEKEKRNRNRKYIGKYKRILTVQNNVLQSLTYT